MGAPQYATADDYRTYCDLNATNPVPDNLTLLLTPPPRPCASTR